MSEYETVRVERRDDGSALLELNRPDQLNAWNFQFGVDLLTALEELGVDPGVRAILLTGAGRGFSSGADLTEIRDDDEDGPPPGDPEFDISRRLRKRYHPIIHAIRATPKPVVAAVNGPAAGIGCSLALSCDLILAAESSFLMLAFVNIGLVPDGGSSAFVPARAGIARATEMAMLGEKVPAQKALEWGLINRIVPDDELRAEADALVGRLAAGPTKSYAHTKALMNRRFYGDLDDQLLAEADAQRDAGRSEDFLEGVLAFMQKRPAEFKGE